MTTENSTQSTADGPRSQLREAAGRRVSAAQSGYLAGDGRAPGAKAQLAKLRVLDPLRPAADPSLYEVIFGDLPSTLVGTGDEPSRSELALAMALHLHAVHQQGRSEAMHSSIVGLGKSMQRLAIAKGHGGELSEGVVTRLNLLVRATSPAMRLQHLRSIVRQLRDERIPLDYGQLAVDLYDLARPDTSARAHLAWARDFHARPKKTPEQAVVGQSEME